MMPEEPKAKYINSKSQAVAIMSLGSAMTSAEHDSVRAYIEELYSANHRMASETADLTARLERANLVLRIVAASYFDDNGEVTISEIPLSTRKEASAIIGGE